MAPQVDPISCGEKIYKADFFLKKNLHNGVTGFEGFIPSDLVFLEYMFMELHSFYEAVIDQHLNPPLWNGPGVPYHVHRFWTPGLKEF